MKKLKIIILFAIFPIMIYGQAGHENVQQIAETFVSAYNAREFAPIAGAFNSQMSVAISSEKLKDFLDRTYTDYGKILKIGTPRFVAPAAGVFPVEFERGILELIISLDEQGKIAGLRMTPPAKAKNSKRNQTKLSLPFKGEWFVFWGGDTAAENYHQDAPNQRFAFDLVKVDASGKTYQGTGRKNEDYYAYGQEIIAPADGEVTYVVDGVQDNIPGEMNRMYVPGNLIIIKHNQGEYSLFAHFKPSSIRVKVGDKIIKGQTIGLCGNTGNSSEPHLHYQFQDSPFFADEASMKVFFERMNVKQGARIEVKTDYSPIKGESISNR